MSRSLVHLREAQPGDAARLAALWADVLRRGDADDQHADMTRIIGLAGADPDQSIVVAEYDGAVAGAVHLRLKTVTPLNLDLSVQVMSPTVLPDYRRHGVGRALMEAAVSWAEERGAGFVATAAPTGSRDANRFLARLALGPGPPCGWHRRPPSAPSSPRGVTQAPTPPDATSPRCWPSVGRCAAPRHKQRASAPAPAATPAPARLGRRRRR